MIKHQCVDKITKTCMSYPRSYLSLECEDEIKIFSNCTNILIFLPCGTSYFSCNKFICLK